MQYDTLLYDSAQEYVDDEFALQLRDDRAAHEKIERALARMVEIQQHYNEARELAAHDFKRERELWTPDLEAASAILETAIRDRCLCEYNGERPSLREWLEERYYYGDDTVDSLVYEWDNW
jgi:hypothetical protein